jgi:endonuclease/exonuclease/phosphatase family metal-dependent hydrolase
MKLATWNIYWLGERTGEHIVRTEEDEALIARVIAQIRPDVLAIQEVIDPHVLERLLEKARAPGQEYTIRGEDETWWTSASSPASEENNWQKTFLCINESTIEFVAGGAIQDGPWQRPYAAELRHRGSGKAFTAVALHFRSGQPSFLDPDDANTRRKQAKVLADWLRGEAAESNPHLPEPATDQIVVLGDFNALKDDPNESLSALQEGPFASWRWDLSVSDTGQAATAINDGYIIDFIIFSPKMADSAQEPRIYAYDLDPLLGGATEFHTGVDGSGPLREPPKVSDHRPVTCIVTY